MKNKIINKVMKTADKVLNAPYTMPTNLPRHVGDRTVLITGASAGIGRQTALQMAEANAHVVLVARNGEKLNDLQAIIEKKGGKATPLVADLADPESIDILLDQIETMNIRVDILVNNAGKSIRRTLEESFDRFHDFERTMQLNYFGSVKLTQGLLPGMIKRGFGHVIHISSIAVAANVPRFSAYAASKSAMDAYLRCLAMETRHKGIKATSIYMPLVRTDMTAPTKLYESIPMLSAESAANMICTVAVTKKPRFATFLSHFATSCWAVIPGFNVLVLNTSFRLIPKGKVSKKSAKEKAMEKEAQVEGDSILDVLSKDFDISSEIRLEGVMETRPKPMAA